MCVYFVYELTVWHIRRQSKNLTKGGSVNRVGTPARGRVITIYTAGRGLGARDSQFTVPPLAIHLTLGIMARPIILAVDDDISVLEAVVQDLRRSTAPTTG